MRLRADDIRPYGGYAVFCRILGRWVLGGAQYNYLAEEDHCEKDH